MLASSGRFSAILFLFALLATAPGCVPEEPASGFGHFEGRLVWIDRGEATKELAEDLTYVDPEGRRWTAPKGFHSDGASIPTWMLSLTGGRFEGRRIHAAVVHDVYCEEAHRKGVRWQDVHRMFYYALRCRGVDETSAKVLYAGVLLGGPRWDAKSGTAERWWVRCIPGFLRSEPCDCADPPESGAPACDSPPLLANQEALGRRAREVSSWIQQSAPDLKEIEERVEG